MTVGVRVRVSVVGFHRVLVARAVLVARVVLVAMAVLVARAVLRGMRVMGRRVRVTTLTAEQVCVLSATQDRAIYWSRGTNHKFNIFEVTTPVVRTARLRVRIMRNMRNMRNLVVVFSEQFDPC
jgi:mRNA-degrading endonuclease toxin of MazEF toxin-antitoxin module